VKQTAKPISAWDIVEKLDGKETKVSVVEVTLEPGQAGKPHRHAGPVIGYVLEGEYEWAQVHPRERDIYANIRLLLEAAGRPVPPLANVPNRYLQPKGGSKETS
jgi:hypothetical protein